MTRKAGSRGQPAADFAATDEWLRLDAAGGIGPMRAFETVAADRFAETDPFRVNMVAAGEQAEPAIAALASGGFVAAWRTGQNVGVQLFDRHGEKFGSEITPGTAIVGEPTVLGLASGGFIVAWSDFENSEVDIWGRIYDSAGNPLGAQFLLSTESFGNATSPSLAALSSGGFMATWTAQDVQFSSSGVKAQIFDVSGARVGGELLVNTTTEFEQGVSLAAGLPGGGFVVAWNDQVHGPHGQIFDAAGQKVGGELQLAPQGSGVHGLTVLSSGNFVVAAATGSGTISGQIFSPAGAPIGAAFMLNTVTANDHEAPTVAALPNGGFVASWREATNQTNFVQDGEIKAQVFDANGVKIGGEFMVNVGTAGGQWSPKVVAFGSGDVVVIWADHDDATGGDVKGRLYFSAQHGTESADYFTGTSDRDFYEGRGGDDEIWGAGQDDVLDGGSGRDMIRGEGGDDAIAGGDGNDAIYGDSFVSFTGDGNDRLSGDAGNDFIRGGGGSDTILGGADDDNLSGGAGSDYVDGGDGNDFVTGFGEEGYGFDVDADVLVGGAGDDSFSAGYGDSVDGGSGTDWLNLNFFAGASAGVTADLRQLTNGGTVVIAGATLTGIEYTGPLSLTQFDDDVVAGALGPGVNGVSIDGWGGNDRLVGTAGTDMIYGGEGDDELHGGYGFNPASSPGTDRLRGEAGNDSIFIDGPDGAEASGGLGDDRLYGGGGQDQLYGDAGDDLLRGGEGDDSLQADSGNDSLYGDGGKDVLVGGEGADSLAGGDGDDLLRGDSGNDLLDGGAGADQMLGGFGDDIYFVDEFGDRITEASGAGYDTVYAAVSYTLAVGSAVEVLATIDNTATTAINLFGNAFANYVTGNAGANLLDGGAGADQLWGRGGDDSYYADAGDEVVEYAGDGYDILYARSSYALGVGMAVEVLATIDNMATTAINLSGNAFDNYVTGNAGANTLDGGGGSDQLWGREGDDSYFADMNDIVIEYAGQGSDILYAGASYILANGLSIETLATADNTATTAINLTGNELDNYVTGNAGANTLDGGTGSDLLWGREGDDSYFAEGNDVVIEYAGQGNDIVYARGSFVLGAGVSVEVLGTVDNNATTAIDLKGNELSNYVTGNAGANVIDGGAGADQLSGRGGADSFAFTTALGGGNIDAILDFVSGSDKIALDDAIFTGVGTPGSFNANAFVVGGAALDADDRIIYNQATGELSYDADGSGAAAAVLFATLSGAPVLSASDFTVI